ncbi:MAG TPA: hypothetical protein VI455_13595 [Terriglobia bacterium]
MEPLKTLRQKRDELIRDARDDPGSEAGEMLQALLLAGLSHLQPEPHNQEAEMTLDEERQRYQSVREQNPKVGAEAGSRHVILDLEEREGRLREVAEATKAAQAALASGQPMDALAVYNRIAEIVGLRAPEPNEGTRMVIEGTVDRAGPDRFP